MASIDFFTVPTATLRVLFVFVVLSHARRRVLHLPGDGTPDSGVDHAANSGSTSVGAGTEISTAGSRCNLWQRLRRPHHRNGDGGSGHRAASALADSLCGTAGGVDPARMC